MIISPSDVAVLRLDNIGDAILTIGLLEALRMAWPQCRIEVWCGEDSAPVFSRCPFVNGVLVLPIISPRTTSSADARSHLQRFQQLVSRRFDLLINPRCAPDAYGAAVYAAACDASVRIAFRQTDLVAGLDPNGAYTILVDPPQLREHAAFVGRHILSALGLPHEPAMPKLVVGRRASEMAVASVGGAPFITMGIGASLPYKIWPPERFAALTEALIGRGYRVVLIGNGRERSLADAIKAKTSASPVDLVGQTQLEEMAALIGKSVLFIGNDSAPKHVAAAVRTPIVEIGWLGSDTPGFPYDRDFDALSANWVRIEPVSGFTAAQTLDGLAIASVDANQVLTAAEQLLK